MSRTGILLLLGLTLLTTACSKPPPPIGFRDRADFEAYVDRIDMPDAWKESLKQETKRVSGKYLNNMAAYLELKGEPVTALLKKYGMKADVSLDGVDPTPAIRQAVEDLIKAGDSENIYKNGRWLDSEELAGGVWDEGKNQFQQASEWAAGQKADRKRGPESQPDFGDVRAR
ncbi:MAG: hypothetical protein HY816_18610 [Candidatus Wallbacteria bacterium]|nr:hypothetical protein [Candidatus Wallbacteria bacterium]